MARLLVLDDRVTNRNILTRLARSIDGQIEVEAFEHPRKALAWASKTTPDLVITDFTMPEMNGAEFIRAFRALPHAEEVPVVVVTVFEDRKLRYLALEAGATDFLLSPVDHEEFRARARNLLTLRAQQLELAKRAHALSQELSNTRAAVKQQIQELFDHVPAAMTVADRSGRFSLINTAARQLLQAHDEDATRFNDADLFPAAVQDRRLRINEEVMRTGRAATPFETQLEVDGVKRTLLVSKSPAFDKSGIVSHVVTAALDITDLRAAEARAEHAATHDLMTGLPNRALCRFRLVEALKADIGDATVAVHDIDLDRFKVFNDAHGQHVSDQVIAIVAERLKRIIGRRAVLFRYTTDSFVALQLDALGAKDIGALAGDLLTAFEQPYSLHDQRFHLSASIGVAVAPSDGKDASELLANASLAMSRAKQDGGQRVCFYDVSVDARRRERVLLEGQLNSAIERDEVVLHYQPQIDLFTGDVVGVEALARWNHPARGLLGPGTFIPLAEEAGLICALSQSLLRRACRDLCALQADGFGDIRVALNTSAIVLAQDGFTSCLFDTLAGHGVGADRLELEITESSLLHPDDGLIGLMRELTEAGVLFSIDDFGTGYSALAYLSQLPVHRLKIDRRFIADLGRDSRSRAIVSAILGMARALDLDVIAEGVERETQAQELRQMHCRTVQGFLFAKPMPLPALIAFLQARSARMSASA